MVVSISTGIELQHSALTTTIETRVQALSWVTLLLSLECSAQDSKPSACSRLPVHLDCQLLLQAETLLEPEP
eukprot:3878570-Rhodomonas_salina.1